MDEQNIIQIKLKHYDRWERLREAKNTFNKNNIKFNVYNNGIQWVVYNDEEEIEYYPTTGRWRILDGDKSRKTTQTYLAGLLSHLGYKYIEID